MNFKNEEFFLKQYGGMLLDGGKIQIFTKEEYLNKNKKLRGRWFDHEQLFFAEATTKGLEVVPDYFYFDVKDALPRLVRYFQFTPTDLGIYANCFEDFLESKFSIWSVNNNSDS